ncbi:MAG TPA: ribosome biogenesis GTPase Der [Caldilineaceae bacterium]|nr:ribosome biogenesis GTPase Der [Caldilineaceae bacterium]
MASRKPVVALVGRPNVGKSTLFNRLVGRRTAIVEDLPGTTRDRIYGESDWNGVGFVVIDTGGLEAPSELGAPRRHPAAPLALDSAKFLTQIQNQARLAVEEADAIIFVVDGKEGMTAADLDIAEVLRLTDKPIFLAVNKTESPQRRLDAIEFWNLGLGEPFPISAYHGEGVGDLLDALVAALPAYPVKDEEEDTVAIAIVGRPNVGKSSLLNALIGMERAIVSEVPGTTRDPIDMEITYEGQRITLIDTAGIRRRGKIEQGIEQYSVLRSMRSIDRADVALLLIDAVDGVTAQDAHVAGYVLEKMKGVVVVVNKWDAVEKDSNTMVEYTKRIRAELKFLDYVPVIYISAKTTQRVHTVLPTALEVAAARRHRLSTGELNQLIRSAYEHVSPPSKGGRPLRIYYATQAEAEPPTFILFVNDPELVHFSYERYLENQIRAHYPFVGTPIRLIFRARRNESGKG